MNEKKSKILWRLSFFRENRNTGRFSYLLPFPAPLFESKNDQTKWSRKRWPENNAQKSFRAEYTGHRDFFWYLFLIQKQEGGNPTIMATTSSPKCEAIHGFFQSSIVKKLFDWPIALGRYTLVLRRGIFA